MPVFSAILAIIFLHEKFYTYPLIGVAFVALGIILSSRSGIRGVPVSGKHGMR